jgi:hypothetical protein
MREQFCSDRADWREMVLFRARQVFRQALMADRVLPREGFAR